MSAFEQLSSKQLLGLFKKFVTECFLLRDKVEEAYIFRQEPVVIPDDVVSRTSTDHITAKLFAALSNANFVLEAIKEKRGQNKHYFEKHPEELPWLLERVVHMKYELQSSYDMHLYDLKRTLERLRHNR